MVCAAAEAAVRSQLHEVMAGRGGWADFANSVEVIASVYPEVLSDKCQDRIVQLFEEVQAARLATSSSVAV